MTDQQHPITPSPELVQQWLGEYFGCSVSGELSNSERYLATASARWGADQELEACIRYFHEYDSSWGESSELISGLRAARRPKPTSLKEQALKILEEEPEADDMKELIVFDTAQVEIIRRALEQLDD